MKKLIFASIALVTVACQQPVVKQVLPLSDPNNTGEWVYNSYISDEFDSTAINEDRWFIVGKFIDGKPNYDHPDRPGKKAWAGRAPSQFSGRNYRLEDGILKLETRWETKEEFPYIEEIRPQAHSEPMPYENITTACFIGRRFFQYGYLEMRSKAADTKVNSAFWAMGKGFEFDFFEMYGDGTSLGNPALDSTMWWSIRDWPNLGGYPAYTEKKNMGFDGADDFHTYGVEWSEEGIKYYIDGKLFSDVPRDSTSRWAQVSCEVEVDSNYNAYVATVPISIWLDNEIFPWHGIPESKEDLTKNGTPEQKAGGYMDFEIDYVRVWQKAPEADTCCKQK